MLPKNKKFNIDPTLYLFNFSIPVYQMKNSVENAKFY